MYPYDTSYTPLLNVPIVSGATAWDDPLTGTTYILIINEALYYGITLNHSLINPNQLRKFGVDLWDNPYDHERGLSIQTNGGLEIPLNFEGTKLRFQTRVPTLLELDTCEHIELTDAQPWEPHTVTLGKVMRKEAMSTRVRCISTTYMSEHPMSYNTHNKYEYEDNKADETILHSINPILTNLKERIIKSMDINNTVHDGDVPIRRTFVSTDRHGKLNALQIADRWNIGLRRAAATIRATTQHGKRSAILPISRRYRADRMYNVK